MNQKGVAMIMAIVLALMVSTMAAVVLTMTFRRFEFSAFRTDHGAAKATAEAGFQYAFARLERDPAFRAAVEAKRTGMGAGAVNAGSQAAEYVVSCHDKPAAPDPDDDREDLPLVPAIHMGNKHLRVRIRFFTQADIDALPVSPLKTLLSTRPYRVRTFSYYGTGQEWR